MAAAQAFQAFEMTSRGDGKRFELHRSPWGDSDSGLPDQFTEC